ncbi:MAG TPA: zinc-dependent metalloprotease, partial [Pyrinomonadaceae bacterium]|nr:zinc-dependent metalloprotease [Pyrinomonadaceae bacterium]
MRRLLLTTLLALAALSPAAAQEKTELKSVAEATRGLGKIDGFFPLYWDAGKGQMQMAISRWNTEFLYQVYLSTGVGSNDLGLDRSQLGGGHVVRFERVGSKVLMVEPNYNFRALTPDAAERRAVEESFGRSVLWGFEVVAADPDGGVLVDATKFFLRDADDVIGQLRDSKQGDYVSDDSRSAFYIPRTKGFRKNTEVEVSLTFTTGGPAPERNLLSDVVPTRQALTVREHHSLVELPDAGYAPRRLDPRVGFFYTGFYDFATPYTEPLEKRWINRHRLQKKDPSAAVSEPVKPIVYYVDAGAPEPIRRAIVEGASWWNAAFEAAGFRNAFQVKVLPPDADPMDVSYNVISWVGRTTRGWSYGETVVDPRTGEIIKGNVRLDALRIRQDYLIGSGLVPPPERGAGNSRCDFGAGPDAEDLAQLDPSADPEQLALARVRQLAAHETGHTLGLVHNYAASTYGRASVMDYPAPLVEIKGGRLDLSNAYAVGVGDYDKFAIRYGYAQFAPGADEAAELEKVVDGGVKAGMLFVSDADESGDAHPLASRWDNGADPVAMLRREMDVRRIALQQFGLANIPRGAPVSLLEAKLLPLYLHHRYQLQAAVKSVGGLYYTYAVRTEGGTTPGEVWQVVPAARQREALAAVLDTIKAEELAVPPRLLAVMPPPAFGYRGSPQQEVFAKHTGPVFDPLSAATVAADLAVSALLDSRRAARLIQFHALDSANPDFKDVAGELVARTWRAPAPPDPYHAAIQRAVQSLVVERLMDLAADADASTEARAVASAYLRAILDDTASRYKDETTEMHARATHEEIERFLARPD